MQLELKNFINFFKLRFHCFVFSIIGLIITGLPMISAKKYIAYILGMIIIWTLPITKNKIRIYTSYVFAALLLVFKGYYFYLLPDLDTKLFPIYTHEKKLLIDNLKLPKELEKNLHSRFNKNIELSEKFPQIKKPELKILGNHEQNINLEFLHSYKFLDLKNTWCMPKEIIKLGSVPIIISVKINKAGKAGFYRNGIFYLDSDNKIDSLNGDGKTFHELKNYEGKTFYFPFINEQDGNWLYIGVLDITAYMPLALLLLLCMLCCWKNAFLNSRSFIEHATSLTIAFATVTVENLNALYLGSADLALKNHEFYSGLFGKINSIEFLNSPLWFLLNNFWLKIGDTSILLPLICMYVTCILFLDFFKKILKEEKFAYIVWGILIATPWFMFYNFGLHNFRFLQIIHSPLILGSSFFLYGLSGYLENFQHKHAISLFIAAMCHPMLSAIICVILLHKHLPKYRYYYFILCLTFYFLCTQERLVEVDKLINNPFLEWCFISLKFGSNNELKNLAFNYLKQAYDVLFIIFALIPCFILSFTEKDATWKKFTKVTLIMHGIWLIEGNVTQDLFLANTLTVITAINFYKPLYNKLINQYAKLTTNCQQS